LFRKQKHRKPQKTEEVVFEFSVCYFGTGEMAKTPQFPLKKSENSEFSVFAVSVSHTETQKTNSELSVSAVFVSETETQKTNFLFPLFLFQTQKHRKRKNSILNFLFRLFLLFVLFKTQKPLWHLFVEPAKDSGSFQKVECK
jgi:hypothetical protein